MGQLVLSSPCTQSSILYRDYSARGATGRVVPVQNRHFCTRTTQSEADLYDHPVRPGSRNVEPWPFLVVPGRSLGRVIPNMSR